MAEPYRIECTLVLRRIYDAPVERVWAAWTTAEALGRWYMADDDHVVHWAEADVRAGGGYRVAFGKQGATPYIETGVYSEVKPMTRLAWEAGVSLDGKDMIGESIVLEFRDLGDGRTELVLTTTGEESWHSAQGWIPCLNSLARYLAA
ncbi:MAG TPA: SRPBCC domain-containing protein [Caulobacteraceae bacterium]|nr:SRPBCC domain-containing protein [Caulobacteraceae bacterium]